MPNLWLKDADGDFINLNTGLAIKHHSSRTESETYIYIEHTSKKNRRIYVGEYKETTLIMQNIERQLQKRGALITLLGEPDEDHGINIFTDFMKNLNHEA